MSKLPNSKSKLPQPGDPYLYFACWGKNLRSFALCIYNTFHKVPLKKICIAAIICTRPEIWCLPYARISFMKKKKWLLFPLCNIRMHQKDSLKRLPKYSNKINAIYNLFNKVLLCRKKKHFFIYLNYVQ